MQLLYKEYYEKNNTGMTPLQFKTSLEEFLDRNLDDFFAKYIYGTETIPFAEYFDALGLEIQHTELQSAGLGITTKMENGKLIVTSVMSGGAAEKAGLSPNDEIIAFNGFRVDQADLSKFQIGRASCRERVEIS